MLTLPLCLPQTSKLTDAQQTFELLVAKNGNISDLLEDFQKKAKLDDEAMQAVRVYEAYNGKFYKELSDNYSVVSVTDYVTLYAERIPEDEFKMEEGEFKVSAFNFDKEANKPHGIPFKFVVKPVSVPFAIIDPPNIAC